MSGTEPPAQVVGTLVSVNVGMPKNVSWRGRTVFTGIFKDPVTGPRRVSELNVDGDGQGDLVGHGGERRAVFVYQLDSYRHWQRELGRDDFVSFYPEKLTITIDGEKLEAAKGQDVLPHGPDRNLSVDEVGGIQLTDDPVPAAA